MVAKMTKTEANEFLDSVKDGNIYASIARITAALWETGDLPIHPEAPHLDGWLKRGQTVCMEQGEAAGG